MSHEKDLASDVIPAKAGIQCDVRTMDPGVRRDDSGIPGGNP